MYPTLYPGKPSGDYHHEEQETLSKQGMEGEASESGKVPQTSVRAQSEDSISVSSPPPQSPENFPGWTPKASFDWAVEVPDANDRIVQALGGSARRPFDAPKPYTTLPRSRRS